LHCPKSSNEQLCHIFAFTFFCDGREVHAMYLCFAEHRK